MADRGGIESGNSRMRRSSRAAGRFASMPHPEIFGGRHAIEAACAASHNAELDENA
jgi:hypothetical protein